MLKPPTIGRLMWLVFVAAILLWLCRQPSFDLPPLPLLVAMAVAFPWIVSPLKMKRIHWTTADPLYEPLELQSEQIPQPVTQSNATISPQLESLGFTNRGHFRISRSVPNGGAHVTLFENRQSRPYAKLFSTFTMTGESRTVRTTVAGLLHRLRRPAHTGHRKPQHSTVDSQNSRSRGLARRSLDQRPA